MILGLQAGGRAGGSSGVRGALPAVGVTIPPHSRARADLRFSVASGFPEAPSSWVCSVSPAFEQRAAENQNSNVRQFNTSPGCACRRAEGGRECSRDLALFFRLEGNPSSFFKLLNVTCSASLTDA